MDTQRCVAQIKSKVEKLSKLQARKSRCIFGLKRISRLHRDHLASLFETLYVLKSQIIDRSVDDMLRNSPSQEKLQHFISEIDSHKSLRTKFFEAQGKTQIVEIGDRQKSLHTTIPKSFHESDFLLSNDCGTDDEGNHLYAPDIKEFSLLTSLVDDLQETFDKEVSSLLGLTFKLGVKNHLK